uniref:Uncharacterized protein n=1 Tax=Mycena chlorophos TaxID=658473 RepID=A0ABQ0M025_MYCCL|nr:predicted protein [Mycena chlorophos]
MSGAGPSRSSFLPNPSHGPPSHALPSSEPPTPQLSASDTLFRGISDSPHSFGTFNKVSYSSTPQNTPDSLYSPLQHRQGLSNSQEFWQQVIESASPDELLQNVHHCAVLTDLQVLNVRFQTLRDDYQLLASTISQVFSVIPNPYNIPIAPVSSTTASNSIFPPPPTARKVEYSALEKCWKNGLAPNNFATGTRATGLRSRTTAASSR